MKAFIVNEIYESKMQIWKPLIVIKKQSTQIYFWNVKLKVVIKNIKIPFLCSSYYLNKKINKILDTNSNQYKDNNYS